MERLGGVDPAHIRFTTTNNILLAYRRSSVTVLTQEILCLAVWTQYFINSK